MHRPPSLLLFASVRKYIGLLTAALVSINSDGVRIVFEQLLQPMFLLLAVTCDCGLKEATSQTTVMLLF